MTLQSGGPGPQPATARRRDSGRWRKRHCRDGRNWPRTIILLLVLLCGSALPLSGARAAEPSQAEPTAIIYFFWGDGCPHCEEARPFLNDLVDRYPQAQIESFEIFYSHENQQFFEAMAAAHGFEPHVVPTIFIGQEHWEGFAGAMGTSIERGLQDCLSQGCPDAGAGIVPGHAAPIPTATDEPALTPLPPEATPTRVDVRAYLFWGNTCPTCEASETHHETLSGLPKIGEDPGPEAYAFLEGLAGELPGLAVQAYDVWTSDSDRTTFERVAAAYSTHPRGVPTIFVGGRYWEGFDGATAAEIRATVEACRVSGCLDPVTAQPAPQAPQPEGATTALMNDLGSSFLVFGVALAATLVVVLIHRVILSGQARRNA